MDATCAIQASIHVFSLVRKYVSRILGTYQFEMDCNHELYYRESNMSCNFRYESVVGTGRVEIVPEEEKEKALTLLMNHYHPESVKFNPKFVHIHSA